MGRLIDADHVKDFFFSETSGTEDVIRVMKAHGNILIKKHGFWTYENCEFHKDHNSNIPIFSCQITTLRVLARRNIVTLDENKGICKLN